MNLYQLYYFKTMSKVSHYTKAAQQLSITQPCLSHAITEMEDELGTKLFEKQGRNVVLTKNGKIFSTYVDQSIYILENGIKKIKNIPESVKNVIHIGFIYTLTSHFIPDLIHGFRSNFSGEPFEFSLQEGTTQSQCTGNLLDWLKEGKLDIVFISLLPTKKSPFEFIPLCEQKLVVITPNNDSICSSIDEIDLTKLGSYPFIHYAGKEGLKQEINRLFAKVNIQPHVCCEVEDEQAMASLVATGLGIAVVPDNPIFYNNKLKVLSINNPCYKRMIYIGYIKGRHETELVQKFKRYVVENSTKLFSKN